MKVNINIQGLVDSEDKREIIEILPELKDSFERRKQYSEFRFKEFKDYKISLRQLDKLTNKFECEIGYGEMEIFIG